MHQCFKAEMSQTPEVADCLQLQLESFVKRCMCTRNAYQESKRVIVSAQFSDSNVCLLVTKQGCRYSINKFASAFYSPLKACTERRTEIYIM